MLVLLAEEWTDMVAVAVYLYLLFHTAIFHDSMILIVLQSSRSSGYRQLAMLGFKLLETIVYTTRQILSITDYDY